MLDSKKLLAFMVMISTHIGSVTVLAANFTDANNIPWEEMCKSIEKTRHNLRQLVYCSSRLQRII